MREVFVDELIKKAQDEEFYFLSADVGFSFCERLQDAIGDRFINVGIAEKTMLTTAAGIAEAGKQVFCFSIGPFMVSEGFSAIRNDIYYHNSNVCLINGGAGLQYGKLGFTHHVYEDLNLISCFENIEIFQPSTVAECSLSLNKIFDNTTPSYIRLGRKFTEFSEREGGELTREILSGGNLSVITSGLISHIVEEELNKQTKNIQLLNVGHISGESIQRLADQIKNDKIIIVEECLFPGPIFKRLFKLLGDEKSLKSVNLEIEKNKIGDQHYMHTLQGFPLDKLRKCFELLK